VTDVEQERHAAAGKSSLWRSVRAVAWGFLGIRKRSGFEEDLARISPLQIIAVGLVAAAVFVGVLVLVVHQVASA